MDYYHKPEIDGPALSEARRLMVTLDTVGNPDRGQDPEASLYGLDRVMVHVTSFEEASALCRAYIEENGLGGGNWAGGQVFDERGSEVARISYNGRVWNASPEKERKVTAARSA